MDDQPPTAVTIPSNPLSNLLRRLEAATSRLEDIASSSQSFENADLASSRNAPGSSSAPELPSLAQGAPAPPGVGAVPSPAVPAVSLPPTIEALDELANTDLKKFVDIAQGLDKNIADQALAVARAFNAQRTYILVASKSKKPDMAGPAFAELVQELQQEMNNVTEFKEANRASPFRDQLSMTAEGMGALNWVALDSKPADWVAEIIGGVQLFGNKVLKEFKEKYVEIMQDNTRYKTRLTIYAGTNSKLHTSNRTTLYGRTSKPTSRNTSPWV